MDFDTIIRWVALCAVCICVRGNRFYVSEQKTLGGQSNCTLALPNLQFNDTDIFAETKNVANLKLPKEGLWIGLFQTQLNFAYVGCNKMNNSGVVLVHSIRECRWTSGCNTLAIRKVYNEKIECKCFDISGVAKETECTSTCSISPTEEYNCGRMGQNYFSVYTVEKGIQCTHNCKSDNFKCLRFMPSKQWFSWSKCSVRLATHGLGIICNNSPFKWETHSIIKADNKGTVKAIPGRAKNYTDAGEKCFAERMFPATFSHIKSSNITTSDSYWTGIIRMNSLLRVDETLITERPKTHAYVVLDGMRIKVRFDSSGTVGRMSLCETQNTSHSTPTSKMENTTTDTRTKRQVEQRVPVAEICTSVSALVVLAILIVIFVILRNRGWLRCFAESKTTMPNEELPKQYIDTKNTGPQTRNHLKACPNRGYSKTDGLPISTKNYTSRKPQMKEYNVDVNKVHNTTNKPQYTQNIRNMTI